MSGVKTRILTDQIYSVGHSRLGQSMGSLEPDELAEPDRALMLKLGLV